MKVTAKLRQRKAMKRTHTLGKSALQPNPRDPAFGRAERTRRRRFGRNHRPQSLVSNLKLPEQLRTLARHWPKTHRSDLHHWIAKTTKSPSLLGTNLGRKGLAFVSGSGSASLLSRRCQTPFPILAPRVSPQDLNSIKEDTRRAVVRKDFQTFADSDSLPKRHMPEFRENVPHANARQAKRFAGRQEECTL